MTTLHILSNPMGITHPDFVMDSFNPVILNFIEGMRDYDYELIHYGHEESKVNCEHITVVTTKQNRIESFNGHIITEDYKLIDIFSKRTSEELYKRKKPNDIILCFNGIWNSKTVNNHYDSFIVEPAIGYDPAATFAPYKVFSSYSQMHYYYGLTGTLKNPSWYDEVIPNSFDPEQFEYSDQKEDYFVYLGRMVKDKGIDLCIQITKYLNEKLVIASPGSLKSLGYQNTLPHVKHIGYCDSESRKRVLSKAKALIAPTYFLEPFGNIVAEALLSGTPVITTDWGGFVDTCISGVTGYRCRSFEQFVNAAKNIDQISNQYCRDYAMNNFSIKAVSQKYHNYFQRILKQDFYGDLR